MCVQVSHRQYVFLMHLQHSIKALQQTLQQDMEEMGSKRDRKSPSQHTTDHQHFTVCLGFLLKSAEVSLLLKPVPQPEGSGSPLGSELSPSESRGTLEPGADGAEKGCEGAGSGSEGSSAKVACTVDPLLCGEGMEGGATHGPAPLIPMSPSAASLEDRTSVKNTGRSSLDDGEAVVNACPGGDHVGASQCSKTQTSDPLCAEPLSGKDWNDKDSAAATKMPQSISRYLLHHTIQI